MNCAEFEQLIDSYLDGELAGSLRVEFDAHRLRCRRCQLTMVAMESVETVIANDTPSATVSDDFTERVMRTIARRRSAAGRLRPMRIIVAAGVLLQAAAVLFLAIHPWQGVRGTKLSGGDPGALSVSRAPSAMRNLDEIYVEADRKSDLHQALVDDIFRRLEAAGANVATDLNHLVSYASALPMPDDLARASDRMNGANPLNFLIDVFVPGAEMERESPPVAAGEHAL